VTSERRIAANRRNALKSTGPRTEAGKAVAARNAVRHGLSASHPLIAGENGEAFAAFVEGMLEDLDPQGTWESYLAERVIAAAWRQRRVLSIEAGLHRSQKSNQEDPEAMGNAFSNDALYTNSFSKLARYESALDRTRRRSFQDLLDAQTLRWWREQAAKNEKLQNEPNQVPANQ
jgi:hypothetical protein